MASSTTKPVADGQGHQRQVVQRIAQQVHHAEGAHQRQRHRHAGNDGGPHIAQKDEDDHDDERDGDEQRDLDIVDRRANGHVRSITMLVWMRGEMDASSEGRAAFTRSTVSMTLAPAILKMMISTAGLPLASPEV